MLPAGYGYPYRTSDVWYLNYMVHDLTPKPFTVWLTYDVDFVPAASPQASGMKAVHPIWLDVQNGKVYPVFDALEGRRHATGSSPIPTTTRTRRGRTSTRCRPTACW